MEVVEDLTRIAKQGDRKAFGEMFASLQLYFAGRASS
jgi:hypothetical protein